MDLLEKLLARTPWTRNRNLERISHRSPATVISSSCASNVRGGKVMQPCAITAGRSNHLRRVLCALVFGSVLLAPYILSAQVSAVVSGATVTLKAWTQALFALLQRTTLGCIGCSLCPLGSTRFVYGSQVLLK